MKVPVPIYRSTARRIEKDISRCLIFLFKIACVLLIFLVASLIGLMLAASICLIFSIPTSGVTIFHPIVIISVIVSNIGLFGLINMMFNVVEIEFEYKQEERPTVKSCSDIEVIRRD